MANTEGMVAALKILSIGSETNAINIDDATIDTLGICLMDNDENYEVIEKFLDYPIEKEEEPMLIQTIQSLTHFLMLFKVIGVECQTVSLRQAIDFPWLIARLEVIVIQIWIQDESISTIFYTFQMILY
ncbi:hypothetical protein Golomagni_04780 [Golovinomyces magnicellulatus]|nr:hypothetical protein Golomagni_04780 [Golovinomyces magnicellulatus]